MVHISCCLCLRLKQTPGGGGWESLRLWLVCVWGWIWHLCIYSFIYHLIVIQWGFLSSSFITVKGNDYISPCVCWTLNHQSSWINIENVGSTWLVLGPQTHVVCSVFAGWAEQRQMQGDGCCCKQMLADVMSAGQRSHWICCDRTTDRRERVSVWHRLTVRRVFTLNQGLT